MRRIRFKKLLITITKIIKDLDNFETEANTIDITLKTIKKQIIQAINVKKTIIVKLWQNLWIRSLENLIVRGTGIVERR